MDKRVTVLLPNGRRQAVNVTANMTLLEILETASAKHGFNSEEHCLKFHNKEVSLTQQFRFSGLPNNCLLEMEPTEKRRTISNVVVCIQLSDGTREQGEFAPSSTLWDVVRQLCSTQLDTYESPVIIYMRSEVIGTNSMQQTTLKSLGILEGRAMMRLVDKKPEELKTQAAVYKPPQVPVKPKIEDDDQPSTSRSAIAAAGGSGGGGFALTSNLIKSLKRTAPEEEAKSEENIPENETAKDKKSEELQRPKPDWGSGSGYLMHQSNQLQQKHDDDEYDDASGKAPPVVNVIGPRHAVLFSLDESTKENDDLPDSFFDLTVNDLKMVLRDLKRTSSGNDDAPLLTAKLRELERQKTMLHKLNQYKDCVLRIQFPDRYVLQGIFKPHEKLAKVEEFVREFLVNPTEPFHLFIIPPKKVLSSEDTLLELNFVPNAVLHFAFVKEALNNENNRFVQESYRNRLTSEEGAHYAVKKYRLTRSVSVSN